MGLELTIPRAAKALGATSWAIKQCIFDQLLNTVPGSVPLKVDVEEARAALDLRKERKVGQMRRRYEIRKSRQKGA